MLRSLVGSEMCIRDRSSDMLTIGRIAYRREGGDGSAQRGRSVIYDCLVSFVTSYYKNRKRLSVCLCHATLAPCDMVSTQSTIAATFYRPVTIVNTLAMPTSRPAARPARIPLGDTLCGYRTVVSVCAALLRLTPQRDCGLLYFNWTHAVQITYQKWPRDKIIFTVRACQVENEHIVSFLP